MTNHPVANSSPFRTINLKPAAGEMIKPAELIDVIGASTLTLAARRMYNTLIANAFGKNMAVEGHEWTISTADLRGSHRGNERIEDSILALIKTIGTVRLADGRTRRVALLGGNDMGDPDRRHGTLTYSFDKRLVPLLQESTVFGKLELKVMRAFSTKYALALYEAIARRVRLEHVFMEEFSLDAFRELLGVPQGKLGTFGNLNQFAIKPAVTEINALAAFSVEIRAKKQGRRVIGVVIGWSRKDVPALKAAYSELQRPRIGRKARISGGVEEVMPKQAELGLYDRS